MIGFWIVSAAFIAAALLFLLPPLLARSPKRVAVERRAVTVSIYQDELSELDGVYVYGDYSTGKIWGTRHDGKRVIWQGELANTEDRIAAARRFYNGNVRDWLVLRDSFPSTIVAGTFGFRSQDPGYFNLDSDAEAVVPRIEALLSPHRLTP